MLENGGTFANLRRLFVNLRKRIQINAAEKLLTNTRRRRFVAMLSSSTLRTIDPEDASKGRWFFCRDAFSSLEASQHKISSMLLVSTIANMYMIFSCCHCLIGLPRRVKVYAEFGVCFFEAKFFFAKRVC